MRIGASVNINSGKQVIRQIQFGLFIYYYYYYYYYIIITVVLLLLLLLLEWNINYFG